MTPLVWGADAIVEASPHRTAPGTGWTCRPGVPRISPRTHARRAASTGAPRPVGPIIPIPRAAHWHHLRVTASPAPRRTARQIRRWRQYLADERAESAGYRELGERRTGEEREILLALADAEKRHEAHWLDLLGDAAEPPPRSSLRTRLLVFLASHFGAVFVLALMQRAEGRSPYETDVDASQTMAADERIHGEVLRGLATRGRQRLSGHLPGGGIRCQPRPRQQPRSGARYWRRWRRRPHHLVHRNRRPAGRSAVHGRRRVRLGTVPTRAAAVHPAGPAIPSALPHLDVSANELALVYRARGMDPSEAEEHARTVLATLHLDSDATQHGPVDPHEAGGSVWSAAISSFCFFASGALIPVLPYLLGATGLTA